MTIAAVYLIAGAVITVLYLTFASHSGLQEPTPAAARAILADWHSTYPCGPAYVLGGRQAAYGVGIEAGRGITALELPRHHKGTLVRPRRLAGARRHRHRYDPRDRRAHGPVPAGCGDIGRENHLPAVAAHP